MDMKGLLILDFLWWLFGACTIESTICRMIGFVGMDIGVGTISDFVFAEISVRYDGKLVRIK